MQEILLEESVVKLLKERNLKITAMESCTSGLLLSTITDVEGASSVTEGGYITYSNKAKINEGVPSDIIDKWGVYSISTAVAMASTCKNKKQADIGVGVTGTFNNVDLNNSDSISGEVYYCIDMPDLKCMKKIDVPSRFIPVEGVTMRHLQKLYVVTHILEKIKQLLFNE